MVEELSQIERCRTDVYLQKSVAESATEPAMNQWDAGVRDPRSVFVARTTSRTVRVPKTVQPVEGEHGACCSLLSAPSGFRYFIPPTPSKQAAHDCVSCHPECLECSGTSATECSKCRNFQWHNPQKNSMECIGKCLNSTYPTGHRCEPCHEACYSHGFVSRAH